MINTLILLNNSIKYVQNINTHLYVIIASDISNTLLWRHKREWKPSNGISCYNTPFYSPGKKNYLSLIQGTAGWKASTETGIGGAREKNEKCPSPVGNNPQWFGGSMAAKHLMWCNHYLSEQDFWCPSSTSCHMFWLFLRYLCRSASRQSRSWYQTSWYSGQYLPEYLSLYVHWESPCIRGLCGGNATCCCSLGVLLDTGSLWGILSRKHQSEKLSENAR